MGRSRCPRPTPALARIMLDYGFNRYLCSIASSTGRANDVTVVQLADLMPDQLTTRRRVADLASCHGGGASRDAAAILIVIQMQRRVVRGLFVKEQKAQARRRPCCRHRHDRRKKGEVVSPTGFEPVTH